MRADRSEFGANLALVARAASPRRNYAPAPRPATTLRAAALWLATFAGGMAGAAYMVARAL